MKPISQARGHVSIEQVFQPPSLPQTPTQWIGAAITALTKDISTYSLMAAGHCCEWLKWHRLASRCYQLGSQFNPLFFHLLGDAYVNDDPNRALGYYQQALPPEPDTQNPNLLKKLAKAHSKQQQWQQAAICLETVFEQQPDDFDTIFHLAEVHTIQGEWFRALYYCKEGLNRDPRNAVLWGHLGFALYRLDDIEGSLKAYQTALQFGGDSRWKSQVAQTLGQLSYQSPSGGGWEAALSYFKQAMQLNPQNADAIEMLGEISLKQGKMDEALQAYNQLLSLTPGRTTVYCALGYVLWQLDRNEEAIDAYLAAIQLDCHNAVALNNLGVIYLDEENNPAKALGLFREAFRIQPTYTLARFNQGRCLQALRQTQEAAQAYSDALALNETHPELEASEINSRLSELFVLD